MTMQAYAKSTKSAVAKGSVADKKGNMGMDHDDADDQEHGLESEIPIDSDCKHRECTFERKGVQFINLYKSITSSQTPGSLQVHKEFPPNQRSMPLLQGFGLSQQIPERAVLATLRPLYSINQTLPHRRRL